MPSRQHGLTPLDFPVLAVSWGPLTVLGVMVSRRAQRRGVFKSE